MTVFACLNDRCYSPVACGAFGHCRQYNIGPVFIRFATFTRFSSISVNGHVYGYMEHEKGVTRIRLARNTPDWLERVRDAGPYINHEAAQHAITRGAPQ